MVPEPLLAMPREALARRFEEWGEPSWRLDQLLDWIYRKGATRWDQMTNLPKTLRTRLASHLDLALPTLVLRQGSADATRKFLWRLRDGALIESVLIPANPALYGDRADRHTLCVSTQVGCAYGCRFCASGLDGWKRNLGSDEIVGQVLAAERAESEARPTPAPILSAVLAPESVTPPEGASPETPGLSHRPASLPLSKPAPSGPRRLIDNLVIMGMGEPLANYDALLNALRILNAPWGAGIGARKITVSTSGLAPQIRRLAEEPEQFRLAISLHGATDAVRSRIMPVNRKYPLSDLTAACEHYLARKGRMLTFEYILLAGVNDDPAQARPLADLALRLHAKVNLIPYNRVEDLPWTRPSDARCEAFAQVLRHRRVPVTLRLEKGHDIDAACGQLRLRTERVDSPAASA